MRIDPITIKGHSGVVKFNILLVTSSEANDIDLTAFFPLFDSIKTEEGPFWNQDLEGIKELYFNDKNSKSAMKEVLQAMSLYHKELILQKRNVLIPILILCTLAEINTYDIFNILETSFEKELNTPLGQLILKELHIDLNRFIKNQESDACGHKQALQEIKEGKKKDHWIWWNFPQMEAITHGIHRSWETSYFGIRNRAEAIAYINNPILKNHLIELCEAIIESPYSVRHIFNNDWIKVRSCMLLFDSINHDSIFNKVLSKI